MRPTFDTTNYRRCGSTDSYSGFIARVAKWNAAEAVRNDRRTQVWSSRCAGAKKLPRIVFGRSRIPSDYIAYATRCAKKYPSTKGSARIDSSHEDGATIVAALLRLGLDAELVWNHLYRRTKCLLP